jgi:hypothetical protein
LKKPLVFLAFLTVVQLTPAAVQSQADIGSGGVDNLYERALVAGLQEITAQWGKLDDSDSERIRTDWHHVIVKKDEITTGMAAHIEDYHPEYLDDQALIERYRKLGKQFTVILMHPMRNSDQSISVGFSVAWFHYEKRKLIFQYSVWSGVQFSFDCSKHEFVVDKVKLGGI